MLPVDADPSDESLMAELQAGDDYALNALMARWEIPLRVFLQRHQFSEHDALDLAQETFVKLYRNRSRYRQGARFSTWLFQIALNLARDHARKRTRRPALSSDAIPEGADPHSPLRQTLDTERANAVRHAVADLPDDLRESILLFEYEHLTMQEIAEVVGSTPKAVENRLYRARLQLREKLSRWFARA